MSRSQQPPDPRSARARGPQGAAGNGRRDLRTLGFAGIVAGAVIVGVAYTAWAGTRAGTTDGNRPSAAGASGVPSASSPGSSTAGWAGFGDAPHVVFQNVVRDAGYVKVVVARLDDPSGARHVSELTCERVHASADRGLCLVPEFGIVTRFWAITFDAAFEPVHRLELGGIPSRARISPDGRYGAATVFVYGHSYADGNFSTATTLIDMAAGTSLGNLEDFAVYRDGTQLQSVDFNFWGVTFARDSNRFYATLRTEGRTYLVEGDVAARTMTIIADNVECPSLSPDNTRIAFKEFTGDPASLWQLRVLDLATMAVSPVAESRSIDDQVEWLDDERILYGESARTWVVPADGTGTPEVFLADALSPAVVR